MSSSGHHCMSGIYKNAGQLGLGSSQPGPILSMVGMCLIKRSLFNKSWRKDV